MGNFRVIARTVPVVAGEHTVSMPESAQILRLINPNIVVLAVDPEAPEVERTFEVVPQGGELMVPDILAYEFLGILSANAIFQRHLDRL